MSPEEFKEANRLMWMVKGHLIPKEYSEKDIESVLKSYFARLWHNEEAYVNEEGFEEAWEKRYGIKQNKQSERRGPRVPRQTITPRTTGHIPKERRKDQTVVVSSTQSKEFAEHR